MHKKVLAGTGALLFIAVAVYLVLGYVLYGRLANVNVEGAFNWPNTPAAFKVRRGPYVSFDTTPYEVADYQSVRLPSREAGVMLGGWYLAGDPASPAVVVTHGFNRCKCDSNVLTAAGMLHRSGFNVLLIDLRNHGESDRTTGRADYGNSEYADVLGAWDWLAAQKKFAPQRVGLYGVSMGAATTLVALGQEPKVPAVFVDSAFIDARELAEDELAHQHWPIFISFGGVLMGRLVGGVDLVGRTPSQAITRDAGRPIYLVHGTDDQHVDIHQNRELAALAQRTGANVTVWVVEGAGHIESEFKQPEEYERRMVGFFRGALGK
jgi:dipeptidyl aminopeptidase/acylaminoacyl peptidase